MLPCWHVHVPAWQHVWNEIDRWRIQRRQEDGRHTRVVGEEKEMRDERCTVKDTYPRDDRMKR